jgi:uncharacterized membrane protein YvbJ
METLFCRNCGQANLPSETACTKCGLNLGRTNNINQVQNSFGSVQNPDKPVASTSKAIPKKNNNLLWILGGAGALVLIGGFFIIVIAAGFFFYTKSGNDEIASNYPISEENQNKNSSETNSTKKDNDISLDFPESNTDTKITDATVVEYLNKRKNVGSFKHISASSQTTLNLPAKMFVLSEASAFSSYMNTSANSEPLILFMGVYDSVKSTKADFNLTLGNVRKNGAKNIKTSSKNGGDAASFSNRGQEMLLTCKSKVCMLFSAKSGTALLEFIESFEKKE